MFGRLKTLVARKLAKKNENKESPRPTATSNIIPVRYMLRISFVRPSARYWAVKRTMAKFIPQSLKIWMIIGTVNTTVYRP